MSSSCEFGKFFDTLIRGRLICGIKNRKLKEKLSKKGNISLEKVLNIICRSDKGVKKQITIMDSSTSCGKIEKIYQFKKQEQNTKTEAPKGKKYVSNNKDKIIRICKRCGKNHTVNNCPAYEIEYEKLYYYYAQCKTNVNK